MNARENYELLLHHEPTAWVPTFADTQRGGANGETWELGPLGGGYDGFGVLWHATESANNAATPDSTVIAIDDVCEWENQLRLPDLDAIDWEAYAESQTAGWNRDEKMMMYSTYNSIFERITHLLGFEEGLCAFYEEPEATLDLCNAITDYKIALVDRIAKYINPDIICHYDDVATSLNLFTSPEVYREFIKPCHTRLNEAIASYGIYPTLHCCGYCTDIIPDFIDEGNVCWYSAQPVNDIAGLLDKYGNQIAIFGGYDTQGLPGQSIATEEVIRAEVQRCFAEYAPYGKSWGFAPFIMGNRKDPQIIALNAILNDETAKCQRQYGVSRVA